MGNQSRSHGRGGGSGALGAGVAMSKVIDFYDDADEFESDLDSAARMATTDREIDGLRDKFEEWGGKMFLSDAQYSWLQHIVDGD